MEANGRPSMDRRTKLVLGAGLGLAVVAAGAGVVVANGQADRETPVAGSARERAAAAALEATGGGTVLEVESGDDGAAYGVEIRTPSGEVVEVHLDAGFAVTGREADDDAGGERPSGD
jgi:hypothetical protein